MRDSPEKGAGMWDHGLLSAGAEKFHNKKNCFLRWQILQLNSMYLLMPPLKETFLKAPSLSYISHPQNSNTQTIRGPQFWHVY